MDCLEATYLRSVKRHGRRFPTTTHDRGLPTLSAGSYDFQVKHISALRGSFTDSEWSGSTEYLYRTLLSQPPAPAATIDNLTVAVTAPTDEAGQTGWRYCWFKGSLNEATRPDADWTESAVFGTAVNQVAFTVDDPGIHQLQVRRVTTQNDYADGAFHQFLLASLVILVMVADEYFMH